jgi:RNA polymerase sigma factor (sigma-70 family)
MPSHAEASARGAADAVAGSKGIEAAIPPLEHELRQLVATGDSHSAISILMREYGDSVFTRARRIVGDRQVAQDVLQQTFLEAYRDLSSFGERSSLRTWLLGIATHRALDAARRTHRADRRIISDDILAATPDESSAEPAVSLDAQRRVRALEECLQALSVDVRATVLTRFQQELSYEEMSRASGEKMVTLHARVARALPVLRRCLERKGVMS